MKKFIILILFIIIMQIPAQAEVPEKIEQLIYSVEVFNGTNYSATYCLQNSDTVYMLANTLNFLWAKKSLAYYWPITNEWKLDSDKLFIDFDGYLEITNKNNKVQVIPSQVFTYSVYKGEYEEEWRASLDADAENEAKKFQVMLEDYQKQQAKYEMEKQFYDSYINQLVDQIRKLREAGKDITALLKEAESLAAPVVPAAPNLYVNVLQKGFVINLPEGDYTIRFLSDKGEKGKILEGSEKKLKIFSKRRAGAIGYEVIPESKFTKPERSFTPYSVIYVDGTTDLYLKPFTEDEYNDLYYKKMIVNSSKGNPLIYNWEYIKQVPESILEMTDDRKTARQIQEKEYVVEQSVGTSLGYSIVPYDPAGAHKGKGADIKAFRIPITRQNQLIEIKLLNKKNDYLKLSNREIHVIISNPYKYLSIMLCFIPLIFMVLAMISRTNKLKKMVLTDPAVKP